MTPHVPRFIAALGLIGGVLICISAGAVMFGLYEQVSTVGTVAAMIVSFGLLAHVLKTLPTDRGVEFAAFYQTSRHAGGDYYDVLPLGDRRFAIMVADGLGHGPDAAEASQARVASRPVSVWETRSPDPAPLYDALYPSSAIMYVTSLRASTP